MINESFLPNYFPSDLTPNNELAERISQLSSADITRIDNWLLSFAIHRWRKIAFLVLSAMEQLKAEIPNLPDTFYILRVQALIEEGRLELDGNIDFWQRGEVRLPRGGIEQK